jgi:hypothetical protein
MDNPVFREHRIVLFPNGPVQSQKKETFTKLLLNCGADINRFWEQDYAHSTKDALDLYINHIRRMRLERCPDFPDSIVAITDSNPPALKVLAARRRVIEAFPSLNKALWIICVDLQENPFILSNLHRLGDVLDEHTEAPIFVDSAGSPFLLLMPECNDSIELRRQIQRVKDRSKMFALNESTTARSRSALKAANCGLYSHISEAPPPTKRYGS